MPILPWKLLKELKQAGLPVLSVCADKRVDYSHELTAPEADLAQAVIAAHDPTDYIAQRADGAIEQARLVAQFKTVTPDQAAQWIDSNVTDLQSAKQALKLLAKMVIAMRNQIWPELADEE